jgi:hypothetical protein
VQSDRDQRAAGSPAGRYDQRCSLGMVLESSKNDNGMEGAGTNTLKVMGRGLGVQKTSCNVQKLSMTASSSAASQGFARTRWAAGIQGLAAAISE